MSHPFEVGKVYQNRNGRYEVLTIQEPKMRIRYENGREALVTIATQARIWQTMQWEAAGPASQSSGRGSSKGSRSSKKTSKPQKDAQQEKLITELLENDETIFEILTRLVIPPGQINTYRFLLRHPDDFFSQDQLAKATRGSNLESFRGVLMAFGRRIGKSPDSRVRSLKPRNALFFEHRRRGGDTVYRIRHRVVEIFASFPEFHDFLINDNRSWLPEEFGSTHWENSTAVYRKQMRFFGFWERIQASQGS